MYNMYLLKNNIKTAGDTLRNSVYTLVIGTDDLFPPRQKNWDVQWLWLVKTPTAVICLRKTYFTFEDVY
jgi:hypothetical protein